MKIKTFLTFILFFICSSLKCQLSLNLRELNYHEFKKYIPDNEFVNNVELNHRGHILEISIINDSEKSISLPLDTLSYALPFTENTKKYYKGEDFIHDPDIFNVLGVYPFVYQKNKFINKEFDMPYHLEIVIPNQEEKGKFKTERLLKIKKWKEKNQPRSDLHSVYNWYILNKMITIAPKSEIKYKIYFNPFLKRHDVFDYHEFYSPLDPKIPYQVTFKLILNKNLYHFLSKVDKKKYPNLFVGVVSSETLSLLTNEKK